MNSCYIQSSGDRVRKTVEEPTWDSRLPDDIEFEIHLLDWLFALEGANGVFEPEETFITQSSHSFREDRCWHSTFRCLSLKAQGTKEGGNLIAARHGKKSSPVQSLVVCNSSLVFPEIPISLKINYSCL